MKITEDSVNHNALLLIEDAVGFIFEGAEEENKNTWLETISYISGVINMANAIKQDIKK